LLAEEEASASAKKATPKAGAKKAASKPAGPGAIAADGQIALAPAASAESPSKDGGSEPQEIESFSATGIDNALDLAEVITAKMDKASIGNQAATIEKHPEVRDPHVPTSRLLHLTFGHFPRRRDDSRCFFIFF
jgi:hypothetical protein